MGELDRQLVEELKRRLPPKVREHLRQLILEIPVVPPHPNPLPQRGEGVRGITIYLSKESAQADTDRVR